LRLGENGSLQYCLVLAINVRSDGLPLGALSPTLEIADMAFIFVQFWGPLPTIHEVFMGDTPPYRQPSGDFTYPPQGTRSTVSRSSGRSPYSENESSTGPQVPSRLSPQTGYPPQSYSSQQHIQHGSSENFNMSAVGNALPDLSYQGYGQVPPQRYPQGPASPGLLYPIQNVPQYTGATSVSPASATYHMPYQGQYQGMYGASNPAQHLQPGTAGGQFYPNQGYVGQQQQQGSPYLVQPNQYGVQSQIYSGMSPQYGMRSSFSGESRLSGQQRATEFLGASVSGPAGRSSSIGM
jgi:hypothetical protein